jgi:hypothetical protein
MRNFLFIITIVSLIAVIQSRRPAGADGGSKRALLGTFNRIESNFEDFRILADLLGDFFTLIKSYDRSCVLDKLNVPHDDPTLKIADAGSKKKFQVAAAMTLCYPNIGEFTYKMYKKAEILFRKYLTGLVPNDYLECQRQLLVDLQPDSLFLSQNTTYGTCNRDAFGSNENQIQFIDTLIDKVNEAIDTDCAMFDDRENLRPAYVMLTLLLFSDFSEDAKFSEWMTQVANKVARTERFLECAKNY